MTAINAETQRAQRKRRGNLSSAFLCVLCVSALIPHLRAQDLYVNFEDIAAGTQDSAIDMATCMKTNGTAIKTRTWSGSAGKVTVVNDNHAGLLRPVTVGGITYANSAPTHALLCEADSGATLQKFTFGFIQSRKVSWGYSITLSNWNGGFNFYNAGGVERGSDYSVLSIVDDPTPYFQNENLNSPYGENINVQNNVTIWVTGLWDSANSTSRHYFYNLTNMTLIGFSIAPQTLNATVDTFTWGITDNHSHTTGTDYRLNNLLLYTNGAFPVWPGSNLQIPTNSSRAGAVQAIAAAIDGDTILMPATNQTWTSSVTLNKNRITLASVLPNRWGSNKTAITISGAITDPNAALIVSGYMNVVSNIMIKGAGVSEEADGISIPTGALSNVIAFVHAENLAVPFNVHDGCLIKYCNSVNCDFILGRDNRTVAYYNANAPLAKTSLKHSVFETGLATWNNSKLDGGAEAGFSSQVGAAWMIRHYDFDLESSGVNPAPGFDAHGESPGLTVPILSGLLLSNRFARATAWNGKFIDIRSPNVWVISNIVTGVDVLDGVFVRNEDAPFPISNCYIKGNKDGAAGNVDMTVQDDGTATAGVDYFPTLPADESMIAFPHPWWVAIVAGTWPDASVSTPPPPAVIAPGAPRIRAIRLIQR